MLITRPFFRIIISLIIFLTILALNNFYQYYRFKSNVAATLIANINNSELDRIRNFYINIENKLKLVQQWGKNGVLDLGNTVELNRQFFPLLEQNDLHLALTLANSQGHEYHLSRKGEDFFTRRSTVGSDKTTIINQQWKDPNTAVNKESTQTGDYDPRAMEWFKTSGDGGTIHWTSRYTFFQSDVLGTTGSVHWSPENSTDFLVFGIDISLEAIERLLIVQNAEMEVFLFLTNSRHDFFITENHSGLPDDFREIQQEVATRVRDPKQAADTLISINSNSVKWLVSMRSVDKVTDRLWVGILARERDLMANLRKELFKVELMEILLGFSGALLVFFILGRVVGTLPGSGKDELLDPLLEVQQLIARGEGSRVEFKSTVRMNLKAGKNGKEIELAWIKAVVAFLNSNGGDLLIGVADDGEILGLAADNFENDDRCQLHIKNLINQHIGGEFTNFIRIRLLAMDDKQVLHIHCTPSPEPVFLKMGKNEEFFIRSGPSNTKLSSSQTVKYVQSRENG